MDSRKFLFYAAGILSDGQRAIAQGYDESKKSVCYVVERYIRNAIRGVFVDGQLEQTHLRMFSLF